MLGCEAMRIFDIKSYVGGGPIEFQIERDGKTRHVRLDAPRHGKPRALRINSYPVSKGAAKARQLVSDIDEWEQTLPLGSTEEEPPEAPENKSSNSKLKSKFCRVMNESAVKHVRDYVAEHYAA
jgi:hypothetical protein